MNEKLNEIDKKLKDYARSFRPINEELFNIGVELGRLLEAEKINSYRSPFFQQLEQQTDDRETKREIAEKIANLLLQMVVKANKEQLKETGFVEYSAARYTSGSNLKDEISEKYSIKYRSITQTEVGGDFDIHFEVIGELKSIFEKHNVVPFFETTLYNSTGEDSEAMYSAESADKSFGVGAWSIRYSDKMTINELREFADSVEKNLLFLMMKNS